MGRTWLLRGCAVAVLAVLSCAWATGVVALGSSPAPATKHTPPGAPHTPGAIHIQSGSVLERAQPRRTHEAKTSQVAYTDPSPSTTGEPTDLPGTPTPSDPGQTHTPSGPTGGSTGTPHPTHDPGTTPPPTQPSDGCTELSHVLNCVLAPITSHP